MTTPPPLTNEQRALLTRVAPLAPDAEELFIRDRDGEVLLELNAIRFGSGEEDAAMMDALCVIVNGYRRQEVALMVAARETAADWDGAAECVVEGWLREADDQIAQEDAKR